MNSGQYEQSPKVAPTVAIDERAEFEKWANENKGGETLQLGGGGTYPNPFANAAFEAWQARAKLAQASTDAPQPAVCAGISNAEKIKEIRVAANFTCTTCGLSAKELLDEYADLLEAMGKAQQPASVPYWFTFPRQPNDGTGWTVDVKYIDYVRERCVEECRPSGEEVESVLLALELSRFGPQQPAKVTPETAVVTDEIKESLYINEKPFNQLTRAQQEALVVAHFLDNEVVIIYFSDTKNELDDDSIFMPNSVYRLQKAMLKGEK